MENTCSIISTSATIGVNVRIGRFCIIEDGVHIGDNVIVDDYSMILSNSVIGNGTRLGTYTKVGRGVRIGIHCKFTSYCEIRDNAILGDRVKMGSRCTLSAGTIVENDVNMKYSFVVTDTPNLAKDDEKIVGILRQGSRFGANVTILPGVVIGRNSEIGACSQVRHNVPDNEVWYGNPAKYYKKAIVRG